MSQTSDIVEALAAAGVPLNSEQLAEQVPHITRANVSALCSQLRKRGVLAGTVEDQKILYSVVPCATVPSLEAAADEVVPAAGSATIPDGASQEPSDGVPPVKAAPSVSSPRAGTKVKPVPFADEAAKPAPQSFAVPSLDIHERTANSAETKAKPEEIEPAPSATNFGFDLGQDSADALRYGLLHTQTFPRQLAADQNKSRSDSNLLVRQLAAAVLQRWPGQIPYEIQRLINSAAALPL